MLDFDRPQDGGTWSCRAYFVAEGTLHYGPRTSLRPRSSQRKTEFGL